MNYEYRDRYPAPLQPPTLSGHYFLTRCDGSGRIRARAIIRLRDFSVWVTHAELAAAERKGYGRP